MHILHLSLIPRRASITHEGLDDMRKQLNRPKYQRARINSACWLVWEKKPVVGWSAAANDADGRWVTRLINNSTHSLSINFCCGTGIFSHSHRFFALSPARNLLSVLSAFITKSNGRAPPIISLLVNHSTSGASGRCRWLSLTPQVCLGS